MNSIRALPSVPYITSPDSERISHRSPDPVASGFQTQLQNQVKLSQRHALTVETIQLKQSANIAAPRLDTDTMLAQLLASRKMLLQSKHPACNTLTTNRKALADCSLAYNFDTETLAVSDPPHVNKVDLLSCSKRVNDPNVLNVECNAAVADNQLACQPNIPAVAMAPLAYIVIWVPPEIIRFPVRFSNGQPLRIRRLRLLDRSGYRHNGNSLNEED